MRRVLRRAGRSVFGGMLMSVWVLLPALPALAAIWSWYLGLR